MQKTIKHFLILCLFLIASTAGIKAKNAAAAAANLASMSGFVYDKDSKETLIGATVYLVGSKKGAHTNKAGFYSITDIEPGKYTIRVSYVGYKKLEYDVTFKKGQSFQKEFFLESSIAQTEKVTVTAEKEVEKRQITVSKVNVPIQQIKEIRIGGESDVFRTLQLLPGILTSSQISSGLYVRGGSPDQNLVLLDDAVVYNPTHLFGFLSTFNSDAIKDVEMIKGGFPAEYGGRMSSVLSITQNNGSQERVQGIGALGLISSKLSLEGPLPGIDGSWFLGGRRTYFELIKSAMDEDPENPLPDFNFYDLNGKITLNLSPHDKLFISGFNSADALKYDTYGMNFNMDIGNRLAALKWTHIWEDNFFSDLIISGSHYFNKFVGDQTGYEFLINNTITDYSAKFKTEWLVSDKITVKSGAEYTNYHFKYLQNYSGQTSSTDADSSGQTNLDLYDNNFSAYLQTNMQLNENLSFQLGGRANYWDLSDQFTFDPRAAARYSFNEGFAIKLAWGLFHQNLRLATQPDFSFFDTWMPSDTTVAGPGRSDHYILSFETNPMEGYDLNFDFYYKDLHNINELRRQALDGETVSDILYFGNGRAYGAEVFLQKKFGRFTGWIGYGMGWIFATYDSINGGKEFRPKYDRRHDLKIVAQYKINEHWDVGATFTFQTGQSYTGASSRIQSRLPGQNSGQGKIVPSQKYGLRLPPSHQLNINASYKFKLFGLPARAILDIYNAYNRRDIWFRYYNTDGKKTVVEDVKLLPILPTFSFEIKF